MKMKQHCYDVHITGCADDIIPGSHKTMSSSYIGAVSHLLYKQRGAISNLLVDGEGDRFITYKTSWNGKTLRIKVTNTDLEISDCKKAETRLPVAAPSDQTERHEPFQPGLFDDYPVGA